MRNLLSRPGVHFAFVATAMAFISTIAGAGSTTTGLPPLADSPIGSTVIVPANVILALSVEFPTGDDASYRDSYAPSGADYVGYFNPHYCYTYDATNNYFTPQVKTTNHLCTSQWSGNFLNWALTQTIDPMRIALTGGYRSVDTATSTVLQKAYSDGNVDGSGFPDKTLTNATDIKNATPFSWTSFTITNRNLGLQFNFSSAAPASGSGVSTVGTYPGDSTVATNASSVTSTPVCQTFHSAPKNYCVTQTYTVTTTVITSSVQTVQTYSQTCTGQSNNGTVCNKWSAASLVSTTTTTSAYQLYGAVQVCTSVDKDDAYNGGTTSTVSRCRAYSGGNYKPTGLIQKYAAEKTTQNDNIRYSVFGYLNDSNIMRDGGVMRSRMKSVGPFLANPGAGVVTNTAAEWDATTGIFALNPNAADATASGVTNSGVLNYLNKFGLSGSYKSIDPVGELYYATTRYYRKLGNVASYTSSPTTAMKDNFPVISFTTDDDPIAYTCSPNYIIGIGDIHTHADANLPGRLYSTDKEPTMPPEVSADLASATGVNAVTATDWVGKLENQVLGTAGGGTNDYQMIAAIGDNAIDSISSPSGGWCCNLHSFLMAGLAYDIHTRDIRPDITTKTAPINVSTFWVDVFESGDYREKNQFWLTAKYGGFDTDPTTWPTGGLEYNLNTPPSTWAVNGNRDVNGNLMPDQYYQAAAPSKMIDGFDAAFSKIQAHVPSGTSTSLALSSSTVASSGNVNYAASYDKNWAGDVIGEQLSVATTGGVLAGTITQSWHARDWLPNKATAVTGVTQLLPAAGAGGRIIATSSTNGAKKGVAFETGSLSSTQLATLGSSSTIQTNVLNYIRGDQTNEGPTGFRGRTYTLGDITNSKPVVVADSSFPYADTPLNPGYTAFKATTAARSPVVYIGSNDGMLHAFDGSLTSSTGGKELFAYVPSYLLNTNTDAVGNPAGLASLTVSPLQHHFMVDGQPVVYDVDFNRTGTSGAALNASSASDWHTVLFAGLGKGGSGYFALDVTKPSAITSEATLATNVLWETIPANYAHMGYSYGPPIVVKTAKYGWAVVLTSGYENDDGQGYIYLTNPKDGTLYEAIATGAGSPTQPAGLAYVEGGIPNQADFTADSLYAGDLLGNLWRVDLTCPLDSSTHLPVCPSKAPITKLASLVSAAGDAQPVTTKPALSVDPTGLKRYVFVGTGQLLSDSDIASAASARQQTFYAIQDGTNNAFDSTITSPVTRSKLANNSSLPTGVTLTSTQVGFYIDLNTYPKSGGLQAAAERVTLSPVASDGVVTFGANLFGQDVCSGGTSRLFALSFDSGSTFGGSLLLDKTGAAVAAYSYNGLVNSLTIGAGANGGLQVIAGIGGNSVTPQVGGGQLKQNSSAFVKKLNWREVPSSN